MNDHEMPPELLEALTRIWLLKTPITLTILPRDTWMVVSVIQFATRNPALSAQQRSIVEAVGRQLQAALVSIDPVLGKYIELGWDPANDVPREG